MRSPIKLLPWDTRTFGYRIARLNSARLTPKLAQAAVSASLKQKVRCLYFLASSGDISSIECAEAYRFHLVDIRVTLAKELEAAQPEVRKPASAPASYRSARPADIRALLQLSRPMFTESRFAVDSHFPSRAREKLFSAWIANSVRGRFDDWVGVTEWRGRLAGFVSCRINGRARGSIGVLGVASAFRRRGLGQGLLQSAMDWFRTRRVHHVTVVTQGRATAAQRFYEECGFRTSRMDLWYHKWF
jgi:GNAT superfamily N-acetyltransferase